MIKIRHTGIVTKDIKKSLYFWNKIFKFKINKDLNEKGKTLDKVLKHRNVKVRTLKLKDDFGNLIELLILNLRKQLIKINILQIQKE